MKRQRNTQQVNEHDKNPTNQKKKKKEEITEIKNTMEGISD